MASWVHEFTVGKVVPMPIELTLGGQEHNLCRGVTKREVLGLMGHERCLGSFMQPRCAPFSAARFKQPGPPVLFSSEHVDGIPDETGEVPSEVLAALNEVSFVAAVFKISANTDKVVALEFPASQGSSSPFAAAGRELHSTCLLYTSDAADE